MTESKNADLVVIDNLNPVRFFTVKSEREPTLKKIEEWARAHVPVLDTAQGRKDIASNAYKISQSRAALGRLCDEHYDEMKRKIALFNVGKKEVMDTLARIRDEVRAPLTEWEAEQKAKEEAERIAKEKKEAHGIALEENTLFDRQREIERREAEIARQQAEKEKDEYEDRIRKEAAEKAKQEAEQRAEADRLELIRKEMEAQAAKERAEREKVEAVEAEKKRAIEAAEKAERDKAAAIAEEKRKAQEEADRKERERIAKEQAEREEAERRRADEEHRRAVDTNAIADFMKAGFSEGEAGLIVGLISRGKITGVSINY